MLSFLYCCVTQDIGAEEHAKQIVLLKQDLREMQDSQDDIAGKELKFVFVLKTQVWGGSVAKWSGHWTCNLVFLGSSPPPCYSLNLLLVTLSSTPQLHFVNSQLFTFQLILEKLQCHQHSLPPPFFKKLRIYLFFFFWGGADVTVFLCKGKFYFLRKGNLILSFICKFESFSKLPI